jgi:hypothetical protein
MWINFFLSIWTYFPRIVHATQNFYLRIKRFDFKINFFNLFIKIIPQRINHFVNFSHIKLSILILILLYICNWLILNLLNLLLKQFKLRINIFFDRINLKFKFIVHLNSYQAFDVLIIILSLWLILIL